MEYSAQLHKNQIIGPIFISIGDAEMISYFLEKNPKVPRNMMLVDDYNFTAYNSMGYGKLLEDKQKSLLGSASMKLPRFGFSKWKDYLSLVTKLTPIPKGSKSLSVPQGVLRLGGTVGLNGNRIVYSYEDGVPGDHPKPLDVIRSLV